MANHQISMDLTTEEAEAFAQFFKRITLSDYRKLAVDNEEAYIMKDAGDIMTKSLRDAGFDPR